MPFHIYLIGIKWLVCVTLHIIEKYVPKRTIFGSRKLQFHCQKPHENKHYYRVSCNGKVTVSQCGNGANKNKTVQVLSVYMRGAVSVCVLKSVLPIKNTRFFGGCQANNYYMYTSWKTRQWKMQSFQHEITMSQKITKKMEFCIILCRHSVPLLQLLPSRSLPLSLLYYIAHCVNGCCCCCYFHYIIIQDFCLKSEVVRWNVALLELILQTDAHASEARSP